MPGQVEAALESLTRAYRKERQESQSRAEKHRSSVEQTASQVRQLREENHELLMRIQDEHIRRTAAERESEDADLKMATIERRAKHLELEIERLKASKVVGVTHCFVVNANVSSRKCLLRQTTSPSARSC